MKRNIPQVIGIGASYAGLSQLSAWLSEHPAVADTIPAANFFNTSSYEKKGIEGYQALFTAAAKKGLVTADCTPGYLAHEATPGRIATEVPDAKLFVVVRHPVYRALAEFLARKKIDVEATRTTAARYLALHTDVQRQGFYAEHLERYFAYYSPIDLYIIVYEELVAAPLDVVQGLYKFLDIKADFVPKDLLPYAPLPEEPKHPSLLYRLKRSIKKAYKRLTARPVPPLFSTDAELRSLISSEEWELFVSHMVPEVSRLSLLVHRDMEVVWGLKEE